MRKAVLLTAAATAALLFGGTTLAHAKTYTQHGNALANYNVNKYKTVKNKNMFVKRYTFQQSYSNIFQTSPTSISSTKGKKVTFKSNVFLPVTYNRSADWGNPQSEVLTKDGKTLYELITTSSQSTEGWIVRYNLGALRSKFGISTSHMDALRRATYDHSVNQMTSTDKAIMKYIKIGPKFNTGHGQSLAMNPKNGQLWFIGAPVKIHSNVQQVSTKTLKPTKKIKFMLKNTVTMGSNLTFDKKGNAYFFTYSNGGWAPKGAVKIYKGKINKKSVKFHLVMQGLRYRPGTKPQSIAYNVKRNRLYFVSDSSISSVPVSKLGHLKAKQVEATNLSGKREFEGIQFTKNGAGYLMTNKGAELMKTTTNKF
ncbi:MAG: hypothetical protein LKH74_03675 [Levilactobacillus sp.]|jgi:uncharacterized protein YjiK|uniref:hypothetical protein n=1 Tax=Levilactobacillus sp. TaxID=2767919 RepID=UPI0025898622|nr:hypothetical protein [Levilactobacillus sp.]MCI1553000.1 hypothetical protein [Levilactobacillus sp.]MCI1598141.1 hypothetical protein [Levilactobacillus sp.]MCI1605530.1 hypothetical protein [Levilactobacillus sp.]